MELASEPYPISSQAFLFALYDPFFFKKIDLGAQNT